MAIDAKKATPEQIARGLLLLEKEEEYKEKVRRGEIKGPKKWKDLSDEEKEKARVQAQKYSIRLQILREKAAAAGITVSPAEIEARMRQKEAAKKA